jgi:tetraacyldisaccharide 4'-kinase
MRTPEFWAAPAGLTAGLLSPFGVVWQAAARLRRAVVRPYQASVPVICIGNLVAGGSGKTPVVLSLVALAAAQGQVVHVVTRGYGGRLNGPARVDPQRHDAVDVGDEALLIAARAPCWVARDRAAGVHMAANAGADAVILDDGFQNPGIEKDLSVLVVDAEYGFGNQRVLPAGPLREPVAAGLARADAVALLGPGGLPAAVAKAGLPVVRAELRPVNAGDFAGARVVAFAGIGRPGKFFASLREAGAVVIAEREFPDHHRFADREVADLREQALAADAVLVTTAKDWARLPPAAHAGIQVLEVEIAWQDVAAVGRLLADAVPHVLDGDSRRNIAVAARG